MYFHPVPSLFLPSVLFLCCFFLSMSPCVKLVFFIFSALFCSLIYLFDCCSLCIMMSVTSLLSYYADYLQHVPHFFPLPSLPLNPTYTVSVSFVPITSAILLCVWLALLSLHLLTWFPVIFWILDMWFLIYPRNIKTLFKVYFCFKSLAFRSIIAEWVTDALSDDFLAGWLLLGSFTIIRVLSMCGSQHVWLESQSLRNDFVNLSKLIDVRDFVPLSLV